MGFKPCSCAFCPCAECLKLASVQIVHNKVINLTIYKTSCLNDQASPLMHAWKGYIMHVLPTPGDLTCLLNLEDSEIFQLQDKELKVG